MSDSPFSTPKSSPKKRRLSYSRCSPKHIKMILDIDTIKIKNETKELKSMMSLETSLDLKKLVFQRIKEYAKTFLLFEKERESFVDDLMVTIVLVVINFFKDKFGITNVKVDREMGFENEYDSDDSDSVSKMAVKGRMEIIVLGNKDISKDSLFDLYPFLIIENKKMSLLPVTGLNQCLLFLSSAKKYYQEKEQLYGILFSGFSWNLINYTDNQNIIMSNTYPFISAKLLKDGEESFLNHQDSSLLIDAIYTIIRRFYNV